LSESQKTRAYRLLLENDFGGFIRQAWHVLEPATPFVDNWHIDLICEYLTLVRRREVRRWICNLPPRHMKSMLATIMFPCWVWTTEPHARFICSSYADSLSIKHSLDRRTLVSSPWYQSLWGDRVSLAADANLKSEFVNDARGHMIATSTGGSITGKGADYIVCDDAHNPLGALSDAERLTALRHFDITLSTRLDQPKQGAIIVIMQRLHEEDLTGHLIEGQGWDQLILPAESETEETRKFPISGRVHVRQPGELLWAERFPQDVLDLAKLRLGSYSFAGQYQQRPSPAEGGQLKRAWWRRYDVIPPKFEQMIQSWDLTFKDSKNADFVVGQVWGRIGANKYLVDQVRRRMTFTETVSAMRALSSKWPEATAKLVEDTANGPAIINVLKNELSGVIAITPKGSKEARAQAAAPEAEAGNFWIPRGEMGDLFIEEAAQFPMGSHDDQIDAWSQAANRFRTSYCGVIEFYERQAGIQEKEKENDEDAVGVTTEPAKPLEMFSSIDRGARLPAPWERE
jgi:predicted phage terminase large subunit-like protein